MNLSDRYIQIDEEGFFLSAEKRILDEDLGFHAFENLKLTDSKIYKTQFGENDCIVEAFDDPYVAGQISFEENNWWLYLPYDFKIKFDLKTLSLDEWDRFHGVAENGIPFVLSNKAQSEFFNLLEEFDDESITWNGKKIKIPSYWSETKTVRDEKYWSDVYRTEENPGWNLNSAAEAFKDMLPRLKLTKSRVLVLGCGEGHDAAHFAEAGHIVTAVDISPEAIARAQKKYAEFKNIKWVEADIFALPKEWLHQFDIVVEHTCFCAIDPTQRSALAQIWIRLLAPQGKLMAIFFTMEKKEGPPFGATEWEIRARLKKSFTFLFWGRWRGSIAKRQGRELFVYAQKRNLS